MYVCICACACVCVCVARIYIKIVIRPMKTISCTTGSGRKKQIKDTNLHLNRGWCRLDPEPSECSFLPRTTRTEKFSSAGYMEFETEPPTAVFMLHKFVYFTIYEHRNGFHTFIVKFHSPYINYYTSKKKKKTTFTRHSNIYIKKISTFRWRLSKKKKTRLCGHSYGYNYYILCITSYYNNYEIAVSSKSFRNGERLPKK